MALKALLLRKQLDDKNKALEALRARDAEFSRREAELEQAIAEAESDADKQAVEALVGEFEQEHTAHEESKTALTGEIAQLEQDLAAEEAQQTPPAAPKTGSESQPADSGERKDESIVSMSRRDFWHGDFRRRDAFLARDDTKEFLQRVREMGAQHRAVTGAELTIPTTMLELIRENIDRYSKLIAHVNLRSVPGKARQNIMGTVPEGVWTEACAKLNELSFGFNQIEVDGYKVGGFIAICNATLEDSDLNLATEIMDMIGQAIGYGVDKAIIYGTGNKMPLGVVTRLAQTAKPSNWSDTAPAWKDLHTSNMVKLAVKTGAEFFKQIILNSGKAKSRYSRGSITWAMNETTKAMFTAEALSINAAGAIVSGQGNTMPVLGGDIVILDFIPDNDVVFGYFDLYLLAERAGAQLAQSEHVRFIEDQTVLKGTARYDGKPVFGECFCAINVANEAVTTSVTFATDAANP